MAGADAAPHVVARVGAMLRAVAAAEPAGRIDHRTRQARGTGPPDCPSPTGVAGRRGLVSRDPKTGRWSLGPELYLLGVGAAYRYDVTDQARDTVAGWPARPGRVRSSPPAAATRPYAC